MDANYAVIAADGTVENIVVWDGDPTTWQPPAGTTTQLITDGTEIDFAIGLKPSI